MPDSTLWWLLAAALVIAGIAGSVLPALPGAPLVFLGLLIAAWIDGFQRVGWFTLSLLAVLTVASFGVDLLAARFGTKRVGASKLAIVGAMLGTFAGIFFGLPGVLLGPFVGAALGELASRRDVVQAGKAGLGAWLGFVIGSAANLALVFTMIGLFAVAYFL
jgi:uncharacterized protein